LIIVAIGLINFLLSRSIASAETKVGKRRSQRKLAAIAAPSPATGAAIAGVNEEDFR
jgi:hypothetical protein